MFKMPRRTAMIAARFFLLSAVSHAHYQHFKAVLDLPNARRSNAGHHCSLSLTKIWSCPGCRFRLHAGRDAARASWSLSSASHRAGRGGLCGAPPTGRRAGDLDPAQGSPPGATAGAAFDPRRVGNLQRP